VIDIPIDHPSCSKQHAVIQYRQLRGKDVKPYLLDIESTNGTFLNGTRLEAARYYELKPKDLITFGESTREYVFMQAPE
jgi:smad nuclear-interacting protein 1